MIPNVVKFHRFWRRNFLSHKFEKNFHNFSDNVYISGNFWQQQQKIIEILDQFSILEKYLVIMHDGRVPVSRAGALLALSVDQPPDALHLGVPQVRRQRGHHVLGVRERLSAHDPHLSGLKKGEGTPLHKEWQWQKVAKSGKMWQKLAKGGKKWQKGGKMWQKSGKMWQKLAKGGKKWKK
jgi:hypothetical protein